VALAAVRGLPGSVVHEAARRGGDGIPPRVVRIGHPSVVRIGHLSGTMAVGAESILGADGVWRIHRAIMSRSARRLMKGFAYALV
jgi:2-methylaconitate isomerase